MYPRLSLFSLILLVLTACGMAGLGALTPPQTTTVVLPLTPEACYERAVRTFSKLPGGVVQHMDAQVRHISGEVKTLVVMQVDVEPQNSGCVVTTHCSMRADKAFIGSADQCERYAELLKGGH